jgi:dienelactone hydrolase
MRKIVLIFLAFILSHSLLFSSNAEALKISQNFLNLLYQNKFEKATQLFDSTMQKQFNHEQLRTVWTQLAMSLGEVKSFDDPYIGKNAKGIIEVITPMHFAQTSLDAKVYVKNKEITGFFMSQHISRKYFVPEYADTTKFAEQELIIGVEGDFPLKAKLTYPLNKTNYPCLILVHGSGPNDMDQTVGPNKIFKDIAYGLATAGIAVLRYEKRTFAYPGKMGEILEQLTLEQETIEDAVLAFRLMKENSNVNSSKIFILGHSLGGYAMPLIAEKTDAAGYIMSAAPARDFEEVIYDQYLHIFGADDTITTDEQRYIEDYNSRLENLKKLKAGEELEFAELPLNMSIAYWQFINDYDIVEKANQIKKPVLVIHNERDYQVTEKDLKVWQEKLDGENFDIQVLKGLNHLFIYGENTSTPNEYNQKASVDASAIELIKNWIESN